MGANCHLLQLVLATVFAFWLPITLITMYTKTKCLLFAQLGMAVLCVTLLFGGYLRGGWNNGSSFTPPFALVAILFMAMLVTQSVWLENRRRLALCGGLALLPYSVAIGTGNTLFTQCIVSLASWGALIGVLVGARSQPNTSKMPICLLGACFVSTVSLQILTSAFRPYHLPASLLKQDQVVVAGALGTVKVDSDTKQFLVDINAAAEVCNIAPGAPFIGLYNNPGVALALQAVPVLSPWLNNKAQAEFVLKRTNPQELRSVVVAVNTGSAGTIPPMPRQMKRFPRGYKYCGLATYPFGSQKIQIWRRDESVG